MAQAIGISLGSVQGAGCGHIARAFKPSRHPSFAAKVIDIVGLYVDPLADVQPLV